MSVSICIPWRSDEPSRIAAWAGARQAWQTAAQSGYSFELVAGDDGSTGPFSRSKAINRAVAASTGDIVVIHGADQLPDFGAINTAAGLARDYGWSMIYGLVQMFDESQTRRYLDGGALPTLAEHPAHAYLCPGLVAVQRELWEGVGGMDERFGTGYGYEDAALRNRLASVAGTLALFEWAPDGLLRGLYHVHAGAPTPANAELFDREYASLAPELN